MVANEIEVFPSFLGIAEIAVPGNACPIKFKPLHLELRRYILEEVGRTDILFPVEEPMNWVDR